MGLRRAEHFSCDNDTEHEDALGVRVDGVHEGGVTSVQPDKLRHGLEERLGRVQPGDATQLAEAPASSSVTSAGGKS